MPWVNTDTSFLHSRQWKWLGFPNASVGPVTKKRPSSLAAHTFFFLKLFFLRTLLRGSLMSVSSLLVLLVCDAWGTAPVKPCSMRSTRPRTSSNPVSNQTNDDHTLRVHVDTTEALLTTHDRLQNLCPFFGANWPAQSNKLMSSCVDRCRNRIVIEMV